MVPKAMYMYMYRGSKWQFQFWYSGLKGQCHLYLLWCNIIIIWISTIFFYCTIFFNVPVYKMEILSANVSLYSFDGRVVAKLPFVPHSWIQGLSHRNLMGTDFTDCSFIFLYILCTMSVRQVCDVFLSKTSLQWHVSIVYDQITIQGCH